MKTYKFRIYPSKTQEREMSHHLWISKGLWNTLLEYTKKYYSETKKFPSKTKLEELTKKSGLYAQTAQKVACRLHSALKRISQMRKLGKKAGFPRFKNIDRMKSLNYPQGGFWLYEKLKVTPFGLISIRKHREIEGKIKTLTLKRESSGKWFAIFVAEQEAMPFVSNNGGKIGIDLGLKQFAVLSNGERIQNPRFYQKEELKLGRLQRELSKRKKGGKNRAESKRKTALLHEKIANSRNDFLHKESTKLVNRFSLIALEDLETQKMAEKQFGKFILDASWSEFARMVGYKAASAGCRTVFVNPRGTSKTCGDCKEQMEMPLPIRTFKCPHCGMVEDRDVNAARNILEKATVGMTGSNACGDEPIGSSRKQETHDFRNG